MLVIETMKTVCCDTTPSTTRQPRSHQRQRREQSPVLPMTHTYGNRRSSSERSRITEWKAPESATRTNNLSLGSFATTLKVALSVPSPAHAKFSELGSKLEVGLYDCPICWERKSKLSSLPCNHIFCTEYVLLDVFLCRFITDNCFFSNRCILKSLERYPRCPLCNHASTKVDVTEVHSKKQLLNRASSRIR